MPGVVTRYCAIALRLCLCNPCLCLHNLVHRDILLCVSWRVSSITSICKVSPSLSPQRAPIVFDGSCGTHRKQSCNLCRDGVPVTLPAVRHMRCDDLCDPIQAHAHEDVTTTSNSRHGPNLEALFKQSPGKR